MENRANRIVTILSSLFLKPSAPVHAYSIEIRSNPGSGNNVFSSDNERPIVRPVKGSVEAIITATWNRYCHK